MTSPQHAVPSLTPNFCRTSGPTTTAVISGSTMRDIAIMESDLTVLIVIKFSQMYGITSEQNVKMLLDRSARLVHTLMSFHLIRQLYHILNSLRRQLYFGALQIVSWTNLTSSCAFFTAITTLMLHLCYITTILLQYLLGQHIK